MSTIPKKEWGQLSRMYLCGKSMRQVAEHYHVPIDAVVYALRKNGTPRRSLTEANRLVFEAKTPSFSVRPQKKSAELDTVGAMLYWAEGYKTQAAGGIDFANSDAIMARLFMTFLRARYRLDEKRFRGMVYCYSNQDVLALVEFWSKTLGIPKKQFTRPYIRNDYRPDGRKTAHGTIHIRYNDKKLLRDVLNLIESCKQKYASVG